MNTIKKMMMACCALELLAPLAAHADYDRDQAMLAAISAAVMAGYEDSQAGVCTPDTIRRMENATAELQRVSQAAAGDGFWAPIYDGGRGGEWQNGSARAASDNSSARGMAGQQLSLVNKTTHGICGIAISPRINYGGARPLSYSGMIEPWSSGGFMIGAVNAHYDIRIVTVNGNPLDFSNVFVGAGTSSLVLTQEDRDSFMITCK